jgi:hypothetical protein
MCLKIAKLGYKILEADDVVVYHSRKPLFVEHLTQVSRFGLHRGFFAKRFGGNSVHLTYLAPAISILALVFLGVASVMFKTMIYLLAAATVLYILASLLATLMETTERRMVLIVWLGIWLTHLTYGLFFLVGLVKHDLER